jgi:DNA-binding transcriptional LysR family regulator
MYVDLDLYRVFHAVAKAGSISAAARDLFISQPALTQSVRKLEDQLGVTLFLRTSRGVKLTPEGETLFQHVDAAYGFLCLAEKKLSQTRSMEDGEIAIGAGDTLCKHYLVPHLKAIHQAYPKVRIHVTNRTTPETIALLKAGKVDLGIINLPIEKDPSLDVQEALTLHDCFVVGGEMRSLSWTPILLSQLATHPMLLLEKGSNSRRYIDTFARMHGVALTPEIELGSNDLLVEFASVGLGIACVVREFVQADLASGRLREVKLLEEIPARKAGIVTMKDVPLSRAASEFMRLLRELPAEPQVNP